jgi:serine/threonine protein phosphatase PrpC
MADNYFGITDVGRMRTNNEDAFFAQKVLDGRYIAACVIDGVGGYEGGEVAASITRQAVLDYFSVSSGDILTMMKEAFAVANEKIAAEKKKNKAYESMACVATLAMVDIAAKTFHYAHIGDTRLYLLRDNSLVKISKDQSFVGYLEDSGRITEEEAMRHPKRNEINNAIGFDTQLNTSEIETGTSPFLPGDLLLLCSDGLSDLLTSQEITSVLLRDDTLQLRAKELVVQANEKGGKDNITVVLVRNHRKPVVQKATKPATTNAAIEKKTETSVQTNSPAIAPAAPQRKKSKGLTLVLGLVCLVLAATVAVLLILKRSSAKSEIPIAVAERNSEEIAFQNTLDSYKSNIVTLSDSLVTLPLVLNDTVRIRRDSLHLQGNGIRLLKSADYNGPALAFAESCKYIMLENVVFQNFDVAILAQNRNLHLRNVRFVGCRVPVQASSFFTDTMPVSGVVHHFFTPDTLSN